MKKIALAALLAATLAACSSEPSTVTFTCTNPKGCTVPAVKVTPGAAPVTVPAPAKK